MKIAAVLLSMSLAACMNTPPKADVVRTGTTVNASAGRTWDAVIEQFATSNIPIRTTDACSYSTGA